MMRRTIGRYTHGIEGPLLIVLSSIHGNEPAGLKGLDFLFKMLEVEPITNPQFQFAGELIGLIGNIEALKANQRYIDKDLNRIWSDEIVYDPSIHELKEKKELIETIKEAIEKVERKRIIVLDIHTTSSDGGIFTIPGKGEASLEIARGLNAPVVRDMIKDVKGTVMEYYNSDKLNLPIDSLTFEAGMHTDPLSINRAIAAIINCMKHLSMVNSNDVESIHDNILKNYSKGLPRVTRLLYRHKIEEGDHFTMNAGYLNFQPIEKGEPLAIHNGQVVTSPQKGRILMPLYQSKGNEGFYIIAVEE